MQGPALFTRTKDLLESINPLEYHPIVSEMLIDLKSAFNIASPAKQTPSNQSQQVRPGKSASDARGLTIQILAMPTELRLQMIEEGIKVGKSHPRALHMTMLGSVVDSEK